MADAIVSIALERLAAITENTIREEIGLVRGVKEEVRHLSSELTDIRNVLEDAEKKGYKEKSIQSWLKKLEDISYDVDDVLDEWAFANLKLQIEGSENFTVPRWKVCSFIPWSCLCIKKVATHHHIAVKIKGLKERLDRVVKEKERYNFVVGQVVNPQESECQVLDPKKFVKVSSTSSVDEKEIQGREVDKEALVSKLVLEGTGQESSPNVISIVGTGGIGKTTVAQLVYNDKRVINCFGELRIWICVSDVFDEVRIAKGIVEIVTKSSPNIHELEALLKCVTNSISGKKFLLVLDDVWTEDYNQWKPLKNSLKCGGRGSKILVTTRNKKVARMMGTTKIHQLDQLSDTKCWLLMKQRALFWKEEECEELCDIGKNIAKKCKGLPLAATVLGSLLSSKDTVEEWKNVLNSEIWQLEQAEVELFPHLLLSYNELSSTMKRCFSYCAIFPKDFVIDVKNLIRMWMALGYLGSDGSLGDLELKGKEYFDNLRMRSFFQDFVERDDKMTCKMHDIVHDFAQFLTKRRSHNSKHHDGRVEEREKRSCQALDSSLVSQIKVNRSLFCPKELSPDLLDCVTFLKVLSLCNCGLKEIPGNIANLIHLRYLDLSGNTLILHVLQTLCKLYYLQTLYLRDCKLKEIPREIENLIQLRHLDLSLNYSLEGLPGTIYNLQNLRSLNLANCYHCNFSEGIHKLINLRHLFNDSTNQIPQGLGRLTGLQTLTKVLAPKDGSKLGYLKKLDQLSGSLKLNIRAHDQEDVEEAKKAALGNKKHIKCLTLMFLFKESDGEILVQNEVMEALQPPPNLQNLTILLYQGTNFPNWMTLSLNHLKVLEFNHCNYCTTLPPLGKLPCLEKLLVFNMGKFKFLNREFLGISGDIDGSTSSSAVVIGFPKLKELSFMEVDRWKEWEDITAEEEINSELSIMPCLKSLSIVHCELMTLPHQLLRKASALEYLMISRSSHLSERYKDKNGPGWRFLSHIPIVDFT